jgi:DNA helicase-4
VKSRAEKLIADFLFTHQVTYRYEDLATWAETAPEKGEYSPDFYLPEHEVYIEHWGVDESGAVAPWFSWTSAEYREKIEWARAEVKQTEYCLAETYEFEHEAGRLKQSLKHRLSALGVDLDRMEFEELVESAFEYEQREGWIKRQFRSFIENAKRFDVKPGEIKTSLSESNPRQYHFGCCGIYLLQQYVKYLMANGLVDYTDMIHDAVDLIQKYPEEYKTRYDHILVDEFQDIGKGKLELIQELTGPDAAKLFVVGDDWQSIFSFQGAVVEYFTEFEEYFGTPVRTDLTANFRSPRQIVEAGNHLIENNSAQLDKHVTSQRDRETTPYVHTLQGYNFPDYVRRVRRYTLSLVQQYQADGADPSEIMILCRFDDAVPYLDEIKNGLQSQNIPYVGKSDQYRGPDGQADDGMAVYSLYQAKGREAKHVILVHAAEGPYGLPPNSRENELVDPVQPMQLGGLEEERRAFYVAVTRAETTLDLLTRAGRESLFLGEIADFTERVDAGRVEPLDEVGEYMTVEVKVEELRDAWTKQHQRGTFADRYGGSALFVSWESNDPPTLEEGEWYKLSGVRVGEYNDNKELVVTGECSVTHLSNGPIESATEEL